MKLKEAAVDKLSVNPFCSDRIFKVKFNLIKMFECLTFAKFGSWLFKMWQMFCFVNKKNLRLLWAISGLLMQLENVDLGMIINAKYFKN